MAVVLQIVIVALFGAVHALDSDSNNAVGTLNQAYNQNLLPLVVNTTYGPIRGQFDSQSRVFRGIPYAAPPIGDLRWKPPESPQPWTEVYDATQIKPGMTIYIIYMFLQPLKLNCFV